MILKMIFMYKKSCLFTTKSLCNLFTNKVGKFRRHSLTHKTSETSLTSCHVNRHDSETGLVGCTLATPTQRVVREFPQEPRFLFGQQSNICRPHPHNKVTGVSGRGQHSSDDIIDE